MGSRSAAVRIDSGPNARAVLARLRAPGATEGATIRLAQRATPTPESARVVGHELVHASAASGTTPRLFGDPRQDEEERIAATVGNAASAAAASANRPIGHRVSPSARDDTTATDPGASSSAPPTVLRTVEPGATEEPATPGAAPAESPSPPPEAQGERTESEPVPELDRNETITRMIEQIEEHLLVELDRRGGRFEGVF